MVWLIGSSALAKPRLPDGWGSTGFNKTNMPHEESSPTGQLEWAQPAPFAARRRLAAKLMPHLSSQKLTRLRSALAMGEDLGVR